MTPGEIQRSSNALSAWPLLTLLACMTKSRQAAYPHALQPRGPARCLCIPKERFSALPALRVTPAGQPHRRGNRSPTLVLLQSRLPQPLCVHSESWRSPPGPPWRSVPLSEPVNVTSTRSGHQPHPSSVACLWGAEPPQSPGWPPSLPCRVKRR